MAILLILLYIHLYSNTDQIFPCTDNTGTKGSYTCTSATLLTGYTEFSCTSTSVNTCTISNVIPKAESNTESTFTMVITMNKYVGGTITVEVRAKAPPPSDGGTVEVAKIGTAHVTYPYSAEETPSLVCTKDTQNKDVLNSIYTCVLKASESSHAITAGCTVSCSTLTSPATSAGILFSSTYTVIVKPDDLRCGATGTVALSIAGSGISGQSLTHTVACPTTTVTCDNPYSYTRSFSCTITIDAKLDAVEVVDNDNRLTVSASNYNPEVTTYANSHTFNVVIDLNSIPSTMQYTLLFKAKMSNVVIGSSTVTRTLDLLPSETPSFDCKTVARTPDQASFVSYYACVLISQTETATYEGSGDQLTYDFNSVVKSNKGTIYTQNMKLKLQPIDESCNVSEQGMVNVTTGTVKYSQNISHNTTCSSSATCEIIKNDTCVVKCVITNDQEITQHDVACTGDYSCIKEGVNVTVNNGVEFFLQTNSSTTIDQGRFKINVSVVPSASGIQENHLVDLQCLKTKTNLNSASSGYIGSITAVVILIILAFIAIAVLLHKQLIANKNVNI